MIITHCFFHTSSKDSLLLLIAKVKGISGRERLKIDPRPCKPFSFPAFKLHGFSACTSGPPENQSPIRSHDGKGEHSNRDTVLHHGRKQ